MKCEEFADGDARLDKAVEYASKLIKQNIHPAIAAKRAGKDYSFDDKVILKILSKHSVQKRKYNKFINHLPQYKKELE